MVTAGKQQQRRGGRRGGPPRSQDEFDHVVVEVSRVTRVMAGGKRMKFRAAVVVGDKKGRVGFAVGKALDVSAAVTKATTRAKKQLVTVPMVNETIPHMVRTKFKSCVVLLKPAPKGTGMIAGGPIRAVIEMAGIHNIVSKMLGSQNKINNVQATLVGLRQLRVGKKGEARHD